MQRRIAAIGSLRTNKNANGFGSGRDDSAGVRVLEINATGKVVVEHPQAQRLRPTDGYVLTGLAFQTSPSTSKVRYILEPLPWHAATTTAA